MLTATTGFKQINTGFIDDHSRKPAIGKHPGIFEKHWYANPLKLNGTDLRGDRAEPKHGKKVSQAGFE